MNTRPAPGVQGSVQHRGGAPAYASVRRAASQHGQDLVAEYDRVTDDRRFQARLTNKAIQLDGLQMAGGEPPREPPKGKPPVYFGNTVDGGIDHGEPSIAAVHLPVPPRPSLSVPGEAFGKRRILPGGTGVKSGPVSAKTFVQDPPAAAIVFPGGGTIGIHPWTGDGPEDAMSEALVKGGISNKPPVPNETNTARPTLWPALKSKSGLQTLSTVFTAVLEKRQSTNRLTTQNSFKPPPRLTIRDSNREAWLYDLANPDINLRRLSRTIPHGIGGRVLLDQCLKKRIDIPRALWLAKCVGLNEVRAHKRKGQAQTNTWLRGWTSSIEQFLDGVITTVGQPDWQTRMAYAMHLVTLLFKERLVEEEHFIDWVLKSLESCSSERLFIWLIIMGTPSLWHSLTSSRRRSRRLVESLLGHAQKFYHAEGQALELPVVDLLESAIAKITLTVPSRLLLPQTWESHREVRRILVMRNTKIAGVFAELDQRNKEILSPPTKKVEPWATKHSYSALCRLLDAVDYKAGIPWDALAFQCAELVPDHARLISAVLRWASSRYRQGSHRLYLATRLLRKFKHCGIDVAEGIMLYIPHMSSDHSQEPDIISRIIAELIRSKTFPLIKYLNWLIATGSLNQAEGPNALSTWPLRLLTQVPLTGLAEQEYNLRNTLLRGTRYTVEEEQQFIERTKEIILKQLPTFRDAGYESPQRSLEIESLSQTIRLESAMWLKTQVISTIETADRVPTKDDTSSMASHNCTMSRFDFDTVRSYVEKFEDLSILADVIALATSSNDPHVLSACTDALCYHYKDFVAIGAFDPVFQGIVAKYQDIRAMRLPERELVLSLSVASRLVQVDSQLTRRLASDLSRYEQKNSPAACSPASDTMVDNVNFLDPSDDIERILSSGNSMDQRTMERVFVKVTAQLGKGSRSNENISNWFHRLRNFERNTFDAILTEWLCSVLANHSDDLLNDALPLLIASGSLTLFKYLETIKGCMRRLRPRNHAACCSVAVAGLISILPYYDTCEPPQDQYAYHLRTEQAVFYQTEDCSLLGLIKETFELFFALQEEQNDPRFSRVIFHDRLLSTLRHYAIINPQNLSFLLESSKRAQGGLNSTHVGALLDRLLDPSGSFDLSRQSYEQQATFIYEHVDQLSLPFCQLKLQHLFILTSASEHSVESIPASLINYLEMTIEHDHSCLLDLVIGQGASLRNLIHERAEEMILRDSAFLCDKISDYSKIHIAYKQSIRRCLDVAHASSTGTARVVQSTILMPVVERFRGAVETLNHAYNASPRLSLLAETAHSTPSLCSWVKALLHLLVLQSPGVIQQANHQHQTALMASLCNLFTHPQLADCPRTAQYIFDVAIFLSDYIAEDARKNLIRVASTKVGTDARIAFILGIHPPVDGWLALTKPIPRSAVSQPGPSKQGNSSQPQMQGQQQPSTGAMIAQRSSNQHQQLQQQQSHSQVQGRTFPRPQHQQSHKDSPQQTQPMQVASQQRGGQLQRAVSSPSQSSPSPAGKSNTARQEKTDTRTVPYVINRWELLPDTSINPAGNETPIDLTLFNARKV
ncbi:RNA polymerase II mediator complex subunit [Kalmusia sp. IMI 367209]|nr:RNA polymerase II mediator complex subunit [Kalmusia sp. IMI 367209]